ncbi:MAG: polyprenyl synthetase family protein [Acidobacteriota bacterium]
MSQTSLKDRLLVATLPAEERETGRRLLRALAPIEAKLKEVETVLIDRTRSGIPTIALIGDYLVEGGGKRIRPALLLLGAHMLGYEGDRDVRYGAMIEFIHTATLVHDDIIDDAETRRGRTSVNRRWGNELTVLFGDFLYMKSMEIALEEGDLRVLRVLSDVTLRMTEGEIIGAERRGLLDLTLEGYLDIVRRKTALLFAGACKIPSYLVPDAFGQSSEAWGKRLWEYGLSLGIAFQLQDDLLDYTANEADLGKPVLSDLKEGKLTLPLILCLPQATRAERKLIETVVKEEGFDAVRPGQILEIVHRLGALDRAHGMAEDHAERAREIAASFPETASREGFLLAAEYAANRRK